MDRGDTDEDLGHFVGDRAAARVRREGVERRVEDTVIREKRGKFVPLLGVEVAPVARTQVAYLLDDHQTLQVLHEEISYIS
jgi:hypothetical protein